MQTESQTTTFYPKSMVLDPKCYALSVFGAYTNRRALVGQILPVTGCCYRKPYRLVTRSWPSKPVKESMPR